MDGYALSSMLTVTGIMAGTVTIFCACGIFQYNSGTASKRNRILASIGLLLLTVAIFTGSYLVYPKCPECNKTMNSEFCTSCGTRVQEEYPTCPTCNIDVATDFCGKCGRDMRGEK